MSSKQHVVTLCRIIHVKFHRIYAFKSCFFFLKKKYYYPDLFTEKLCLLGGLFLITSISHQITYILVCSQKSAWNPSLVPGGRASLPWAAAGVGRFLSQVRNAGRLSPKQSRTHQNPPVQLIPYKTASGLLSTYSCQPLMEFLVVRRHSNMCQC